MKVTNDPDKFLYAWRYLEVAKYIQSIKKVSRIKNGDSTVFIECSDIEKFREANNNTGLYTSVWYYNNTDLEKATRLSSLYFDIDSSDAEIALLDARKLYENLVQYIPEKSILVYFTGKKGFHIECESTALGINPSNNLPNIFRFIAEKLKKQLSLTTLDFSVYDPRRMWRLEGSQHQDTKLFKNLVNEKLFNSSIQDIIDLCKERSPNLVEDQIFSAKANQWFREFTYDLEIEKEKSKDFIGYFNKYGSTAFKQVQEKEKEFTPDRLLNGCTAVARLYKEAQEKHFLEHEARLFLCSILTYDDDSIKFLHKILSNCDDYNVEKTTSHVNDWIRRRELGIGGRPYTCDRANSVGVGCGECSLEKKKKWIKVGDKYVETEEVSSPSPIRFAYKIKGS
jgi:hypothetical protein